MAIVRITEDNFKDAPATMLVDSKWYPQVEQVVVGVGASCSAPYAVEVSMVLADKIDEAGKKMSPGLYTNYIRLLKVLNLYGLRSMSDKDKQVYFQEQILDMFWLDFVDVQDKIDLVFRAYYDAKDLQDQLRALFIRGFEKNKQTLGFGNIKITVAGEEKLVAPTIQNWLADYNSVVHLNQQTKTRGGFEHVNYTTHSANVALLSKEQQTILLKVVQFYDWLLFDPLKYEILLPEEKSLPEAYVEFKKPEKYLSDDVINLINEFTKENSQTQGSPSYVKKEKFKLLEELSRDEIVPKGSEQKSSKPAMPENRQPLPPSVPQPKGVKAQRPMEEVGRGEQRISNFPSFAKATEGKQFPISNGGQRAEQRSNNEKTASGEATDSSTLKNFGPARVAGATSIGSTTLKKEEYQEKNSNGNNKAVINQKPRLTQGNLADSELMFESGLLSNNRITQNKNVVSGGATDGATSLSASGGHLPLIGEKNNERAMRTPGVVDNKPDSTPVHPHLESLYQNPPPLNRTNIQDILKKRQQEESMDAGLRMGDGEGQQISNIKLSDFAIQPSRKATADKEASSNLRPISNGEQSAKISSPPSQTKQNSNPQSVKSKFNFSMPKASESKQKEIDRKLEELGKRTRKQN